MADSPARRGPGASRVGKSHLPSAQKGQDIILAFFLSVSEAVQRLRCLRGGVKLYASAVIGDIMTTDSLMV